MMFTFGNCELDCNRRELHRNGIVTHVEPQVFDVLVYLMRHRDRIVSKEELIRTVWDGRIVSDDTLTSRVSAARRAIGDTGAEQRLIRTVTRCGFRFVGEVREEDVSPTLTAVQAPALHSSSVQQSVRFCETWDKVHLAVAVAGRGMPLVKTANWLNHIEFDWESPVWSPLFSRLAAQCQLVRYDERGIGLSERDVPNFSFEAFVHDLETVVDDCGLQRFGLLGISQGVPVSIAYAVRHPERVSRLVLCGGFAKDGASVAMPERWPVQRRRSLSSERDGARTIRRRARCSRR
jgi:DNA-binding winged helix-turn-helix (wHTH) protein